MPARSFRLPIFGLLLALYLIACQPETVTETVEVTRVIYEYVEVEGEAAEVTRVVTETEETAGEAVEVTRVIVEQEVMVITATPKPEWFQEEPAATAIPAEPLPTPEPAVTPISEPGGDTFEDYGVNPFIATAEDPFSTFAIDVDTGAYTIGRQYLLEGFL